LPEDEDRTKFSKGERKVIVLNSEYSISNWKAMINYENLKGYVSKDGFHYFGRALTGGRELRITI
jgi:hypothetical protein